MARAELTELRVTAQLVGWRRTRMWGHGDLVTSYPTGAVIARLPLGMPGRVAAAVEARCSADGHPLSTNPTVTLTGSLDVHPRVERGPVITTV